MKRVYFTEDKPTGRLRKLLAFVGVTLLLAAGVGGLALRVSGHSETLFDLVDSQKASAQAGEGSVLDDNAGRPDRFDDGPSLPERERGQISTPDPRQLVPEDEDATSFKAEKMQEIQADILSSLQAMREIQRALDERVVTRRDEAEEEQMIHLAKLIKIVNSMRPEDAANMVDKLDNDLAVTILASLTGGKASRIMSNMNPEKAARLGAMMVALKPERRLREVMENWEKIVEDEERRANAQN